MLYIGCPKRASKSIPNSRQSKSLTAAVDDGTKGATANLGLFSRLKKFSNSYTVYEQALDQISKVPDYYGRDCDIPGFRVVMDADAEHIKEAYDAAIQTAEAAAHDFIYDLPHLKEQIVDSYADPNLKAEVEEKLSKTYPTVEDLIGGFPQLKVIRPADLGMVPQSEIEQMLLNSAIATKVELISKLDSEVLKLLEELSDIKRVKGQGERMDNAMESLTKLIQEFSDDPDVVDRWGKALDALKAIPTPTKGDSSIFPEVRAKAKDALSIFEVSPEPEQQPDPDEDASWNEDDELELDEHLEDLDQSHDEAEQQEPEVKKPLSYPMEWDDDENFF